MDIFTSKTWNGTLFAFMFIWLFHSQLMSLESKMDTCSSYVCVTGLSRYFSEVMSSKSKYLLRCNFIRIALFTLCIVTKQLSRNLDRCPICDVWQDTALGKPREVFRFESAPGSCEGEQVCASLSLTSATWAAVSDGSGTLTLLRTSKRGESSHLKWEVWEKINNLIHGLQLLWQIYIFENSALETDWSDSNFSWMRLVQSRHELQINNHYRVSVLLGYHNQATVKIMNYTRLVTTYCFLLLCTSHFPLYAVF